LGEGNTEKSLFEKPHQISAKDLTNFILNLIGRIYLSAEFLAKISIEIYTFLS